MDIFSSYFFVVIKNEFIFASVIAKVAQLVEHDLAKVGVAGSNPVFRSKKCGESHIFFEFNFAHVAELVDVLL